MWLRHTWQPKDYLSLSTSALDEVNYDDQDDAEWVKAAYQQYKNENNI